MAMSPTSSDCSCAPQPGNSAATTDANPSVMPAWEMSPVHAYLPDALVEPGDRPADTEADEREPDDREGDRDEPDGASASSLSEAPTADEKDDQDRRRAALHGRAQRVALRHRQILDHQSRGDRRQERLELLRAADLAENRAHGEEDQRDLASDVAHVQREQRADEDAEGDARRRSPRQIARGHRWPRRPSV